MPTTQEIKILLIDDSSMSESARTAIAQLLSVEGGYVNDPDDKGLETKYGITKRWYQTIDIPNLTILDAAEIYYKDYWLKNHCSKLPPHLSIIHFDCSVNQGNYFARKTLQRALGVVVDGLIGEKTIKSAFSNPHQIEDKAIEYTRLRCKRYANLAQKDVSQIKFIKGWIERAFIALQNGLNEEYSQEGEKL